MSREATVSEQKEYEQLSKVAVELAMKSNDWMSETGVFDDEHAYCDVLISEKRYEDSSIKKMARVSPDKYVELRIHELDYSTLTKKYFGFKGKTLMFDEISESIYDTFDDSGQFDPVITPTTNPFL